MDPVFKDLKCKSIKRKKNNRSEDFPNLFSHQQRLHLLREADGLLQKKMHYLAEWMDQAQWVKHIYLSNPTSCQMIYCLILWDMKQLFYLWRLDK